MIYNRQNKPGIITDITNSIPGREMYFRVCQGILLEVHLFANFAQFVTNHTFSCFHILSLLICLLIIFLGFSCQHYNQGASMTHLLFKVIRADFLITTYAVKHTSMN